MERFANVFTGAMKRRGLFVHAEAAMVVTRATQWIQQERPQLSRMTSVRYFRDGELRIDCEHAIAQQECQDASSDLLQYLLEKCPMVRIQAIRVARSEDPLRFS